VEFVQGDIRDADAIRRACRDMAVVYHNIAQVPLAKDKKLFHAVNVGGTAHLLAAAEAEGVGKVVYTSSSAVFGVPRENPVTEETDPQPGEAYGRAKLDGERLCLQARERGLATAIIRPRTILGHGRLGIFQILFEWVRTGYNIPVLGRGENLYQFVHAEDLAEACILAAQREGSAMYNCGAASYGTMRETLEALCAHADTGSRVVSIPMAPAVGAMKLTSALGLSPLGAYHALMYGRSLYFDISKAQQELGWQPRFSNNEMIVQSYEWYVANRESILKVHEASTHRAAVRHGILNLAKHFF
jgi:nucleoside-diphosphate-sugar epimerase